MRGAPALGLFFGVTDQPDLHRNRFNLAAAAMPFWLGWRRFVVLQLLAIALYMALWYFFASHIARVLPVGRTIEVTLTFVLPYLILGALQGLIAERLLSFRPRPASVLTGILTPLFAFGALLVFLRYFPGNVSHDERFVAVMEEDLWNLVAVQEAYFNEHRTYRTFGDTIPHSFGVDLHVGSATRTGWNAGARHYYLPTYVCGIFVGDAPSPIPGAREGRPKCRRFGP